MNPYSSKRREQMRLSEYREYLGYTLAELADKLGVSQKELMVWEEYDACLYPKLLCLAMNALYYEKFFEKSKRSLDVSEPRDKERSVVMERMSSERQS